MRPTKDEYFLRMSELVATRATCFRRAVGCVLTNERGHVLATGYNGVAAGRPHCNEKRVGWVGDADVGPMRYNMDALPGADPDSARVVRGEPQLVEVPSRKAAKGKVRNRGTALPGSWVVDFYPHRCAAAHAASGTQLDGCGAIHAEQNALLQCRDVFAISVCYCTNEPCITCVKLLLNTSCQRIVAGSTYAGSGRALWEAARGPGSWTVGRTGQRR